MTSSTTSKLLLVVTVLFVHLFFIGAAFPQNRAEPRWVLLYSTTATFYVALYFRRQLYLRRRRGGVYRGLGYTAVMLAALLSAVFFFTVDAGMPLPLIIAAWVGIFTAAYFLYLINTLHLDEEFEQVNVRPPV